MTATDPTTRTVDQLLEGLIRTAVADAMADYAGHIGELTEQIDAATRTTFNLRQAADYLGVGTDKVRQLITDGELRTIDFGNSRVVIARHQLDRFLHQTTTE